MEFGQAAGKQTGGRRTRLLSRLLAPGPEVVQDLTDDSGIFDGRNDPDGTATVLTDLDINAEYPLETASPRHCAVLFSGGRRPVFNAPLAAPGWGDPCTPQDANARLKKLVAERDPEIEVMKEIQAKKW